MPARTESIHLCNFHQPGQVMDFPLWWDRRGFFEKYADRQIDLGNPIYVDYAILLTKWEAVAWDKRCNEMYGPRSPAFESKVQEFQSALKETKWVVVVSSEWESGMD